MGCSNSFIDILRREFRTFSDDLTGGGIVDFEGLAGSCIFEFAVYIAFLDEKGGVVELYMKCQLVFKSSNISSIQCSPLELCAWLRRI